MAFVDKRKAIENDVSDRFRSPAPTLISSIGKSPPVAFSHIVCNQPDGRKIRSPQPEDAYAIQVMMRDVESARLWLHGREVPVNRVTKGGVFILHLESEPVALFSSPFETMRIYMPKTSLDELARDSGCRRPEGLKRPDFGAPDAVLHHLAASLIPMFGGEPAGSQLMLDHIALAMHSHLIGAYCGPPLDVRSPTGGLSPWQERRAKDFIEASLNAEPTLAQIAVQCGLSTSHFARAFRNTTGRPPHKWLLERRVEAAKRSLLDKDRNLAQIAIACGFSDSSHFSRVFSKITGETPASWRRVRLGK